MTSYSSHIKQSALKNVVTQDIPCLEKLAKINELLGLPPPTETIENNEDETERIENGAAEESPVVPISEANTDDSREKSIENIIQDLTGKSLKLAKQFIIEIEKNPTISWDYDTLEVIIDETPVLHSNIRLLIQKFVIETSAVLPLGLVEFVNKLLQIKLPLKLFKSADVLNIREALLKIRKESGKKEEVQSEEQVPEEDVESRKRSLEEEEEESEEANIPLVEEEKGKKRKRTEVESLENSENINFTEQPRRSKRIKSNLPWKANENV